MKSFYDILSLSEGLPDEGLESQIDAWDWVMIIAYFALVMGIGIWAMYGTSTGTEEGYFMAGRFMTWLPVGASLFATNIGSEHYVGLSGSGAEAGIAVAAFEFNALFLLPLLAWVFLPTYIASGAGTLPEYMTKRYGGQRIRMVLSVVSLIMYIFTKNSVDMYSGALFIQQSIGWDIWVSIAVLLILTVLSTIAGGLAAVIYTDTLQCFIMILGAFILFCLGIVEVGGFDALTYKYPRAVSPDTMEQLLNGTVPTCGVPPKDAWQMLRHPLDHEMPWPGFVFGQTTSSLWYWCADQMMVQRVLAAKNLSHGQAGCIACGYIKFLPLFILVLPGMMSRVLYPSTVACSTQEDCQRICESSHSCSNIAYPKLVLGLMPSGMRGFMIAVILSATMSDLSSTFNSASTLFTMDMYKHVRKGASIRELMIVGRIAVVVVVAVGVSMIPLVMASQGSQLFVYIQEITNYFSSPIAAIYLVAILWKRGNEKGAFWSLLISFLIGCLWLVFGFIWVEPSCGEEDNRPAFIREFHYMYYALAIFWFTVIVNVVVSLFTPPPDDDKLIRTMYFTRNERRFRKDELEMIGEELAEEKEEKKAEKGATEKEEDQESTYKMVIEEVRTQEKRPWTWSRFLDFICGIDESPSETVTVQMTPREQKVMLAKVTALTQDKGAKWALGCGGVSLIVFGTFFYIFFSVEWNFQMQPKYYEFDY